MLYYIFKYGMINNNISCPATCPTENISIMDAIAPLKSKYPDIEHVFSAQSLPINFANETDHPMHSCWLSLFDESAESLLYLVTETVATGGGGGRTGCLARRGGLARCPQGRRRVGVVVRRRALRVATGPRRWRRRAWRRGSELERLLRG